MQANIWHNPACGTSRKTLEILAETPGLKLRVVEYLKDGFAESELRALIADAGLPVQAALRLRGTDAAERGLPEADEATVIAAMLANPAYVERPFVRTDKGARLCRPQEKVREIL